MTADVQKNIVILNNKFNELVELNFTGDEIDAFYGVLASVNNVTEEDNILIKVPIEDLEVRSYLGQQGRNYRPLTFYRTFVNKANNNIYNVKTKSFIKLFDTFELVWENREIHIQISPTAFDYFYNGQTSQYFKLYLNLLKNAYGRRAKRLYRLFEQWEDERTFSLSVEDYMSFVCAEVAPNNKLYWSVFASRFFEPVISKLGQSFEEVMFETEKRTSSTKATRQRFYVKIKRFKVEDIKRNKDERIARNELVVYTVKGNLNSGETTVTVTPIISEESSEEEQQIQTLDKLDGEVARNSVKDSVNADESIKNLTDLFKRKKEKSQRDMPVNPNLLEKFFPDDD